MLSAMAAAKLPMQQLQQEQEDRQRTIAAGKMQADVARESSKQMTADAVQKEAAKRLKARGW